MGQESYSRLDTTFLNDKELEKLYIGQQSTAMKERAPGKYNTMLFVVKMFPNFQTLYHFGRAVDDITDGDRSVPQSYNSNEEYLDYLKSLVSKPQKLRKDVDVEFFMARSVSILKQKLESNYDVEELFISFIDSMKEERGKRGQTLTYHELENLYDRSFTPPQDIAFIATGATVRSKDIPELAQVQGRSYALSDLKIDMERGDCRIPSEVLNGVGLKLKDIAATPQLLNTNHSIQNWIKEEKVICREQKATLLGRRMDFKAKIVCRFLTARV